MIDVIRKASANPGRIGDCGDSLPSFCLPAAPSRNMQEGDRKMRNQLIAVRARLSIFLVLALLAVSFLPSFTPSARAGNTGQIGDGDIKGPPQGGPDEPTGGPAAKGTLTSTNPRHITSSAGDMPGDEVHVKGLGAQRANSQRADNWMLVAKAVLSGFWLHR